MKRNFCALILSHGRPDGVITYNTLRRSGYTGPIYIVIDNTDTSADKYYENFGEEYVIMFDKIAAFPNTDSGDTLGLPANSVVYARNECFRIAQELGYDNFIELDDDYCSFSFRYPEGSKTIRNLDYIFNELVTYLNATPIKSICFSQGGDHMGGFLESRGKVLRKAMNSFICKTDRPFEFYGRINEDTTMYVLAGTRGDIFLTVMNLQLSQKATQQNSKGLTDIYLQIGTYVKSFYTVMFCPNCVRIALMGRHNKRLHHKVLWEHAIPRIIPESYKKR